MMNDTTTQNSQTGSYPVVTWTWHDGKGGTLSTQISGGGQVRQVRQHDPGDIVAEQDLGVLPAEQADTLLAHCREALRTNPSNAATLSQADYNGESYQLVLSEGEHQIFSRQVPRAALNSDGALAAIRSEVLAARNKVWRRWNIWTSAGARWFFLTVAVTVALGIYIVTDIKHDNQLQSRAHTTTGTVVEQGGNSSKNEYLMVSLKDETTAPEVRIYKYLSHPNWEAAKVGSQVDVVYDAQSGQGWLNADLQRWQHDKKTIWMIPGFLLAVAFVGLAWLRRYQIGVASGGDEYMILEDRVVTDDKDHSVSRSTLLWFKMFV